jgi:hypothetical protein
MNDCPNADVRDLLPDLVHGRLDAETRASVESHVGSCADCRAELVLLRELRASTNRVPTVDVAAIAASLPAYRSQSRRSWVGWRTAAAVTLIVAGGSSIIVTQRIGVHQPDSVAVVKTPVDSPAPVTQPAVEAIATTPPAVTAPRHHESSAAAPPREPAGGELAMSAGTLTDLSDRELTSLLKDIESLDAVPSTDVESVPVSPVAPHRGGR